MAKNLKLKIKNTQLAEALNLKKTKGKKADASKDKPKKASSKTKATVKAATPSIKEGEVEATEEQKKPKKKIKATDRPTTMGGVPAEAEKEPEIVNEEQVVEEVQPPKEEITSAKTPAEAEVKEEPKSKTDEKQVEKKATGPRVVKRSSEVSPKKTDSTAKDATKPKKVFRDSDNSKPNTSYKNPKDTKTAPKRVEQKRFDSRDRQGLRESEDGQWRRRRPSRHKAQKKQDIEVVRPKSLSVKLPITVKDLAGQMKLKASELITKLFLQGITVTINDYLDDETTVLLLGAEFGCDITIDTTEEQRLRITDKTISEEIAAENPDDLKPRPPVVTFMGHVDHGKTSLIDSLRKSNLTAGEAGAITQHIGAFQCHTPQGDITVLDTPGHEAFSEMRMRGANVTDIVILVIAGDEGMKPQTEEAIDHAKEAGVPIIVAINKCDKPSFNPDDVYRQLSEKELLPESWGGSIITVNCSAKTGQGIPELLEMILLQSEVLELKGNPKARARGTVLESQLHHGLGHVATVLVQNGSLKVGDALVVDNIYGRIKTMHNEHKKDVPIAPPAFPVKITGLSGLPEAGDEFIIVKNEKEAKAITQDRAAGDKRAKLLKRKPTELEGILKRNQELQEKKILTLIIRADVQGSLEALKNALIKLPSDKVEINIISEGVGQISESDIELAHASSAAIIGFHTGVESHAESLISNLKVSITLHDIIYHLIDKVKEFMVAKLDKIRQENEVGEAKVQKVFKSSHLGIIAGCIVSDGIIKRTHYAKLVRNDEVIWEGQISSLKRVQEDVKEVSKGIECGIILTSFKDIQEGDLIKSFEITYLEQTL